MSHQPLIVGAVAVLFEREDGKILLMKRRNTGFADGMYSLPSGHVELRESFQAAAAREAHEETGAIIRPENMKLFHISQSVYGDGEHSLVTHFYKVSHWQGEITNTEPDKCGELVWVDPAALPEPILIHMKHAVRLAQSHPFSTKTYPMVQGQNTEVLTNKYWMRHRPPEA